MKIKNLMGSVLLGFLLSAFSLQPSAFAQAGLGIPGPLGCTVVPLVTNLFGPAPTNSILAGSAGPGAGLTNLYPTSYVYTNIYSNIYASPVTYTTNIITNTVTGYLDCSKLDDLVVQFGFSCTNTTDVSNVVVKLFPALDGVNPDTTNSAFWLTNTSPGSNSVVTTFVFSSAQKAGITGFFVGQVINYNTNQIFPALTNSTGSNYQFMQYRGRKTVVY